MQINFNYIQINTAGFVKDDDVTGCHGDLKEGEGEKGVGAGGGGMTANSRAALYDDVT